METSPTTAVARNGVDGARPKYASVLQERFDALDDEERGIIECHLLADSPLTLEDLGKLRGVTRERIRQIEVRGLERLFSPGPRRRGRPHKVNVSEGAGVEAYEEKRHASEFKFVEAAIEKVRALPLPITEGAFVEAGFEPFDAVSTRLLKVVAKRDDPWRGAFADHGGRRWLVGQVTPSRFIAQITEDVRGVGVVEDLVELWEDIEERLGPHVGSAPEAEDLAAEIVDGLDVVEVGDRYAILGGGISIPERLVRILRANGAQMTAEVMIAFVADRATRSIRNKLYADGRIVQVSSDQFALAEWGATRRPTLLELVYGAIDEYGNVSVDYLERLAVKHLYSASSIGFYRGLPDLIEEAGVLRRRMAHDPSAIPEPGLDDTCVRVIAGPHRGRWSTIVRVNHRRLYTGPQKLPSPLASFLGMVPGVRRMPIQIEGAATVQSTWGSYPYLFGGELRHVLDALGFADGSLIRIIVCGQADVAIEPMPEESEAHGPVDTLVAGAGLYDETGEPLPYVELGSALAYAVGLEPDTPLFMVGRRLSARRDAAVTAAFGVVFAGEVGA